MTPRRFLFWVHLAAGTVAGLVIFVMSVTGVLLAYKRQILNRADRGFQSQPPPGAQRLPVDELLAKLQIAQNKMPSGITVRSAPAAPVSFDFGRERTVFVDPYTGQALGEESPRLRAFFSKIEDVHRWLGMSSENRLPHGKLRAMIRQIAPQFFTTDMRMTLVYYSDKLGFDCLSTWQDLRSTPSSRATSTESISAAPPRPRRIPKSTTTSSSTPMCSSTTWTPFTLSTRRAVSSSREPLPTRHGIRGNSSSRTAMAV